MINHAFINLLMEPFDQNDWPPRVSNRHECHYLMFFLFVFEAILVEAL